MADLTALRRSPLQDMAAELRNGSVPGWVTLLERPFLTMVSIRVEPASDPSRAIEATLGTDLPQHCGEVSIGPDRTQAVLWMGPDEWLVVSEADAETLVGGLRTAAGDGRAQVVDVSANRTVIELSGSAAREVLEKGCPTDLHPRAFADGTAITTTLARVPVVLWKIDGTRFQVMPRASLARYVAAWLLDAAHEFSSVGEGA
jgi:sarcosine oxidase subunit gamma